MPTAIHHKQESPEFIYGELSIEPRAVDEKPIRRWLKGGLIITNRRLFLFLIISLISVIIGASLSGVWGLFYLSIMLPLSLSFWVPLVSDKSENISILSIEDLTPMIIFSLLTSVLFFIVALLLISLVVLVPALLISSELDKPLINAAPDKYQIELMYPALSMMVERCSNSLFFISFLMTPIVFIFYIMLYSGASGKESFHKFIDGLIINLNPLMTLLQLNIFSVLIVQLLTLIASSFDNIYAYLLISIIIFYTYSVLISISYLAFKDIHLGNGSVDDAKESVKYNNLELSTEPH